MVLRLPDFLVELEFGNVDFWGEGKTEVPEEKPLRAKGRPNNKIIPHTASTKGFELGPQWWKASALTTAPPLLPKEQEEFTSQCIASMDSFNLAGSDQIPSTCLPWCAATKLFNPCDLHCRPPTFRYFTLPAADGGGGGEGDNNRAQESGRNRA